MHPTEDDPGTEKKKPRKEFSDPLALSIESNPKFKEFLTVHGVKPDSKSELQSDMDSIMEAIKNFKGKIRCSFLNHGNTLKIVFFLFVKKLSSNRFIPKSEKS